MLEFTWCIQRDNSRNWIVSVYEDDILIYTTHTNSAPANVPEYVRFSTVDDQDIEDDFKVIMNLTVNEYVLNNITLFTCKITNINNDVLDIRIIQTINEDSEVPSSTPIITPNISSPDETTTIHNAAVSVTSCVLLLWTVQLLCSLLFHV